MSRRVFYAFIIVIVACVVIARCSSTRISAQEKLVLTTPLDAPPAVADYDIANVRMGRLPTWELSITWRDNAGNYYTDNHNGVWHASTNPLGADVMVKALNKANLSVKALEKRAFEHLQDPVPHGGIAKIGPGSVTGSPQAP